MTHGEGRASGRHPAICSRYNAARSESPRIQATAVPGVKAERVALPLHGRL